MTVQLIRGTGVFLPERVVTNAELEREFALEPGWIEQRTGIRERRFAAADQSTGDLAAEAARQALADAGADPQEIDLVVLATSTPDWPQPATAAAVHGALGMRADAGSVDVNAVCSGFVYALQMAYGTLLANERWQRALVIGADTYSRITDPEDRRTRVLFGDGAGAVVLEVAPGHRAPAFAAGTDSAGLSALIVPGGGSREPLTAASLEAGRAWFAMDGRQVREYAVPTLARAVHIVCGEQTDGAGVDAAFVVPHQSNLRILEQAMERAGLAQESWHATLPWTGNTAAASIPVALDDALRTGRVPAGADLVLIGYGGGLSWAAMQLPA